jgi:hypothetical protein
MDKKYIITNEELAERGLDLNDYALNGDLITAIIYIALDIVVIPRVLFNCDNLHSEDELELALGDDDKKIKAFKKLQYMAIHSMIFQAETSPIDVYFDTVIAYELNIGKINDFQKGIWYKNY